jgi:hypothetical protein
MSGHKRSTITLSREELQRLQDASRRMSLVDQDFRKVQEEIAQLRAESAHRFHQKLEDRQQTFNHALRGVSAHLVAIEYSTSQAVVSQAEALQAEINRMGNDVWENTHLLLAEHAQQLEETFAHGQAMRQAEYQTLRHSIKQVVRNEKEKWAFAEQSLQESQALLENLKALYAQEPTARAPLAEIQRKLAHARKNLEAGFSEAALASAQERFDQLSHLRVQLEQHIQQRQVAHQFAQERFTRVRALLRENRQVRAINLNGDMLDQVIEVNYWTSGEWRELANRLRAVQADLAQEASLDLERIKGLIQELDLIEEAIPHVVFHARLAVISSQVRYNIAELVVAALHEQGYSLEESTYQANDLRGNYEIRLGNFEGSEIVVSLAPNGSDPIAHELDIAFLDSEPRTSHEMRQRAGELSSSLNAFGLQLSRLQELPQARLEPASPNKAYHIVHEAKQTYGTH